MELSISKKTVSKVLNDHKVQKQPRQHLLSPYESLIAQWYAAHPSLQAQQVYERLRSYGYPGKYTMVAVHTRTYRRKRTVTVYHELQFLPGQEAQVDWMHFRLPSGVMLYGFVFILCYSRYLYVRFYPRCSMEFFLDGHIEAFKEIGGVPRRCTYDNLSSVVTRRRPALTFNPQFLELSSHYHFGIHACTPGRANEKGRVERAIRDIRAFLEITTCEDFRDLNRTLGPWRSERNSRNHRATGRAPAEMLKEDKLISLPELHFKACRNLMGKVSKTGFVQCETNRYSVPPSGSVVEIAAYPERLELSHKGRRIATHQRSFLRGQKIENPLHRQKLLCISPHFKAQRIYQLMHAMDEAVAQFLDRTADQGQDPLAVAHDLFRLIKTVSRNTLLSALREANGRGIYHVKYLLQLLRLPQASADRPVCPRDHRLLDITYEGRDLSDYDQFA
jgi:transposase